MERKSGHSNGAFKMKSPLKVVNVKARQNGNGSNRSGKVNPNSEGNTDLKDGRSKSSTFQKNSPYHFLPTRAMVRPRGQRLWTGGRTSTGGGRLGGFNPRALFGKKV